MRWPRAVLLRAAGDEVVPGARVPDARHYLADGPPAFPVALSEAVAPGHP